MSATPPSPSLVERQLRLAGRARVARRHVRARSRTSVPVAEPRRSARRARRASPPPRAVRRHFSAHLRLSRRPYPHGRHRATLADGAGARSPRGFELPLKQRLPRIGSIDQVGVEARAAELAKRVDQEGREALGARARDPLLRPDDARGRRHAGQGRGAVLEGDPPRPERPERPVGRRGLRLPEPRRAPRRSGSPAAASRSPRSRPRSRPARARSTSRCARSRTRSRRRRRDRHGDRPRRVPLRPLRARSSTRSCR